MPRSRRVELHELGKMLRIVSLETGIPGHKYQALAIAVSETFDVLCYSEDIQEYEGLHQIEDYELESRRHEHHLQSRIGKMS